MREGYFAKTVFWNVIVLMMPLGIGEAVCRSS